MESVSGMNSQSDVVGMFRRCNNPFEFLALFIAARIRKTTGV